MTTPPCCGVASVAVIARGCSSRNNAAVRGWGQFYSPDRTSTERHGESSPGTFRVPGEQSQLHRETNVTEIRMPLTIAQANVFRFIVTHWGERGVYPTMREIATAHGIASPNGVICHLDSLLRKGWIVWDRDTKSRGVRVPELQDAAESAAKQLLKEIKT